MKKKKIGKEARTATLYVRIRPTCKAFVQKTAKEWGVSDASALDTLILSVIQFQKEQKQK